VIADTQIAWWLRKRLAQASVPEMCRSKQMGRGLGVGVSHAGEGILLMQHLYAIILLVRKEKVMETLATTRMSSKGQVVIPESIRKRLDLKEGAQFLVLGEEDVVILKVVTPPDINEFDALIKQAHKQAKEAGLKPKDITSAVARARGHK